MVVEFQPYFDLGLVAKGIFRQRTKFDPNRFNFYEQQGVVVKIKPPCVQTALS